MSCAPHRPYLAAIADGEPGLVPASTLAHVRNCQACGCEIRTHSLLTDRLRLAVAPARGRPASPLRRPVVAAVAALLVALTAVVLAAWHGLAGQDQVAVAAAAAQGPLQLRSPSGSAVVTGDAPTPVLRAVAASLV